jgi:hypothetical protein
MHIEIGDHVLLSAQLLDGDFANNILLSFFTINSRERKFIFPIEKIVIRSERKKG